MTWAIVWILMETSEYAVELNKVEEKDNVMENSYAIFQIREAVGRSQMSSSRSQTFFKIGVLKNVANFTGRDLCWSLFLIKLQALKKRLQHRCFPPKFAKFLRTLFLQNTSGGCFWQMFFKIGALENFTNFTIKILY